VTGVLAMQLPQLVQLGQAVSSDIQN
jgi:hypothetical protein